MDLEMGYFDPNSTPDGADDHGAYPPPVPLTLMAASTTNSHNNYGENLNLAVKDFSNHHPQEEDDASATMEIQFQHQLALASHLMQDPSKHRPLSYDQSNWDINLHPLCSTSSNFLPNLSISFANSIHKTSLGFGGDHPLADPASASSILYDPLLHLNLPPQPPLCRESYQSLPLHGYTFPASRAASLVGGAGDDLWEGRQDGNESQQFDNGVLEFPCIGQGRKSGKFKPLATERQRRKHLTDKYDILRSLIPNPTKNDRASVVGDAIEYIKELQRTVNELRLLVEKMRSVRDRTKRPKTEEDVESSNIRPLLGDQDESYNGSLSSCWLRRKFRDTEIDIRIIEDEVTIKLVQRKKTNSLLYVSKVLDELQLDLHHVAGGHIGDHCSFLFNTKIYEGTSIYASAIANKLIEAVERQYASTPPASCHY